MGRRVLLAAVALSVSCGSRTALLPGGPGSSGPGGSGGSGGGATPQAVVCNAALLDGAPTPTRGYCTTRANQAALSGPHAPTIAWSVTPFPILSPEDYLPAETVVDANGRAYVAINVSPMGPVGSQNQLLAVNADGSVAWMSAFDSSVTELSLGRDGRLWFVQQSPLGNCPNPPCAPLPPPVSFLTALSPDGTNVATVAPLQTPAMSSFSLMAIASDGSFFVGSPGLARVTTDGTTLWQTYAVLGAAILVGPDDGVVATGGGETMAFDSAGGQIWTGVSANLAAVNAQGNVVTLSVIEGQPPSLVTLEGGGIQLEAVTLGSPQFTIDAYQLAVAGDGTAIVLLADEATAPGLTKAQMQIIAVDASGKTRWTTPLDVTLPYDPADLTTHYGVFVDGAGTVVVTAGSVMGLDLASGSVLWTLQPAKPESCLRPAVLGAGGSIIATQCDGTVFLARDP
jgi:hypothetical protein